MKNIVEAKKNKPDISLWDILDKEARKESRQKVITSALSFIKPLSSMRVTDWVENNRVLPDGSSEPGKFKLSRTPYVKEILECMSPHSPVRDVITFCLDSFLASLSSISHNEISGLFFLLLLCFSFCSISYIVF